MATALNKPQLTELTSARFIAAMAVLLGHFADLLALPPLLSQFISGGIGVSFFFVLSGFILCYSYWDTFSGGLGAATFRRYCVARIARIYPLYVLALLLITGLYLALAAWRAELVTFPADPLVSWLANLLAVQTFAPTLATQQFWNAPGWSISTEFAFYLLLPLVLAGIARYIRDGTGLVLLLLLAITFGALAQALMLILALGFGWDQAYWVDTLASRHIVWRLPEFLTGVIAARLLFGHHLGWLNRSRNRNALLLASLATVWLLNLLPWPADPRAFVFMRQFRLDIGYMLPFAGVIVALAAGPSCLSALLRRPVCVLLGNASYALYIFHWIPWTALTALKSVGMAPHPLAVVAVIMVTILASIGAYLWFENPARNDLRQRFG
ncbi:acyltransferase [Rhodoferax sp.]|uniref:acyltransferase family protein n=1 Tax=Rhodoferax sp. TaxID=50421 RepID=UPI0026190BF2|nr:acyltransferase [Rhodoferax sp.]MDD2919832.1 acyltransferase [Rhodoferax sp.]